MEAVLQGTALHPCLAVRLARSKLILQRLAVAAVSYSNLGVMGGFARADAGWGAAVPSTTASSARFRWSGKVQTVDCRYVGRLNLWVAAVCRVWCKAEGVILFRWCPSDAYAA